MAAVDYEAAWIELLDLVASRDGWGSKTLISEAAQVAARHRVSESLVERVIRIYGEGPLVVHNQGQSAPVGGGKPTALRADTPTNEARGGHDGRIQQHYHQHELRC